jgi:6-pyruvoyl tetrahydropterin synthase/QueD family protein
VELTKEFRFEASHILPKHPGRCSRLHGHSWKLLVNVEGPINPQTGFVQDFADISAIVKPLIEHLDHHHLGTWARDSIVAPFYNEQWAVPSLPQNFYPSSENLLCWIALQVSALDIYSLNKPGRPPDILTFKPGQIVNTETPGEVVKLHSWWSKLELEETCTSRATLTRKEFNGAV